ERARRDREETAKCYLADDEWRVVTSAPEPLRQFGQALMLQLDLRTVAPKAPPPELQWRKRGEERLARGESELALADAERALAEDPADGSARLLRAQCLLELDQVAAIGRDLEVCERLAPDRQADIDAAKEKLAAKGGAPEPADEDR
ncbi:MAG TPA: hypothetical protein VHF22_13785, partial [Planctomycetota bacterium]|nr:hypothetical protein [Planctomycetota bacterium]